MEKTPDAEKIKGLWDAHVLPFVKSPPVSQVDRELALLEALRHYRLEAKSATAHKPPHSLIQWAQAIENGRIVWTLLAMEAASWMLDNDPLDHNRIEYSESLSPEGLRRQIISLLRSETSEFFSDVLDPVGILIPRRLVNDLRRALIALDFGTALPIVAPAVGGSKYPQAILRSMAVKHVQFLAGQGIKLKVARARVSAATGTPVSTLRDWEGDMKADVMGQLYLKRARAAGELDRLLESNPDYGKGDGNSIDIDVWQTLEEFRAEPLKVFANKMDPDGAKSWGTVSAEKEQ